MPLVNPRVEVAWTEYTVDVGDVFLNYNLHRVNPHTGEDERIAEVTEITTVDYIDHLAWPGPNTYRLSVTVDRSGAIIESARVDASATISGIGVWVHETPDPAESVHLLASTLDMPRRQGQERRLAAGRRQETAFLGPLLSRDIALQLIPEALDDPEMLDALDRFLDRQYTTGRILCLRWLSRPGARWFVTIAGGFDESVSPALTRGRVTFRESAFSEVV